MALCVINKTLPALQPNVYRCQEGWRCCYFSGEPTCCDQDVSFEQLRNAVSLWLIAFLVISGVAYFISWLFHDEEIDPMMIGRRQKVNKYKTMVMSSETFDSLVEDPVFSRNLPQ